MLKKSNYEFYVIAGIYPSNLSKLESAKYGVQCMPLQSPTFRKVLNQISNTKDMLDEIISETKDKSWSKITYVLFSDNKEALNKFYYFLLLLQPSKIMMMATFDTHFSSYVSEGKKKEEHMVTGVGMYDHSVFHFQMRYLEDKTKNLFSIAHKGEVERANKLLGIYMSTPHPEPFKKLLGIYYEACEEKRSHVRYLLLIMFIESLVLDDETAGVGYKLARMCAVLVGDNKSDANEIFIRVKQCYTVRSRLVHSATNQIHTGNYLLFIHSVVSEILITIILNKLETKDLFKNTTSMAFGDRSKIWGSLKIKNMYAFFSNEMNFILDLKFKK